nr:PREDICTED: uncharacterized protein LOC107397971 [Tribolium castaneum]XP_015835746.1 PREDICTED: uncharacterized protein LOC107397971 [Tribolium castaneum]|eukprot:XP_015835745.1 PREDICTED: uncharacterized protein LOC107397971 [Tribolium castaneum]
MDTDRDIKWVHTKLSHCFPSPGVINLEVFVSHVVSYHTRIGVWGQGRGVESEQGHCYAEDFLNPRHKFDERKVQNFSAGRSGVRVDDDPFHPETGLVLGFFTEEFREVGVRENAQERSWKQDNRKASRHTVRGLDVKAVGYMQHRLRKSESSPHNCHQRVGPCHPQSEHKTPNLDAHFVLPAFSCVIVLLFIYSHELDKLRKHE